MWRKLPVIPPVLAAHLFIPAALAPVAGALANDRDEIIVTSRRKEESLQEVPIAVTAINQQEIENRGLNSFDGLTSLDPSLLIDRGFTAEDTRITVRGLTNTRGRSNVAFLVDGVDVTSEAIRTGGSSALINQRLLTDLERVEIIKGPQSALYGRAAFAGAISYVTKNANLQAVDYTAGLELAEYDRYQISAGVSGPIIQDKLAIGFQAVAWDSDNFYDNAASGQNFGGSDGYGVSFTTNYEPTDAVAIKWRVSYSDDTTGAPAQYVYRGDDLVQLELPSSALESNGGPIADDVVVVAVPSLGNGGNRRAFASEDPTTGDEYEGSSLEILRTSLGINWNIGPGVFTSTTGFTHAVNDIQQDVDYQGVGRPDTIPNNFEVDTRTTTRQVSQDFHYATKFDSAVNYTVGVLGWIETRDLLNRGYIATCGDGSLAPCDTGNWQALIRQVDIQYGDAGFSYPHTDHFSVYGLVDWEVSDAVTIVLEGRYNNEQFKLRRTVTTLCTLSPFFDSCGPVEPNAIAGSARSEFFTPKLTLEYQASDDVLLYASAGKGQKPAGINTLSTSIMDIEQLKFDPEKLWAYEAGWKTSFSGDFGALTFNGALFYQDFSDKQVQVVVPDEELGLIPNIENASAAEVLGQEVQLVYAPPIEGLTLSLAYTHLDTEFTDYVTTSTTARTIAQLGNCVVVQIDPTDPDEVECQVDYTGRDLERSPDHALFASIDLIRPLLDTGLNYLVQFDADWQSERFVDATNYSVLDDRWIANLRLGVQADQWSVIAFADNVLDDDTIVSGGAATPDFGAGFSIPPFIQVSTQLPAPRVVGVRANFKFGG